MRILLYFIGGLISFQVNSAIVGAEDVAEGKVSQSVKPEQQVETKAQAKVEPALEKSDISNTKNTELKELPPLKESNPIGAVDEIPKQEETPGNTDLTETDSTDSNSESSDPNVDLQDAKSASKNNTADSEPEVIKRQVAEANQQTNKEKVLDLVSQLDELNEKMSAIQDETLINEVLEEQNSILNRLIVLLRKGKIETFPEIGSMKQRSFLQSRIEINEERGNALAVQRDQLMQGYYKVAQDLRNYLLYLVFVSDNYEGVDAIVSYSVEQLNASRQYIKQFTIPAEGAGGPVHEQWNNNLQLLSNTHNTYQDILSFVINNPNKIARTHWFQQFSLLSAISFFNRIEFIKPINRKLSPFMVDAGGFIVSFLIVIMIVFCYPLVVKGSSWMIEKYLLSSDRSSNSELIYRELNRPIRSLLVFFSLDLATYALLYKTEYKASFENFVFVIYAWIYVWVLFKMLDSVVIVQIKKITRSNKDLRKELINLGIQIVKGIILIIALAFIMNRFNISISAILSTLGIGGLAFALAAKDSLSNLFGGITILFDNVFRMGDWVKIADIEGTVVEIGLRSTTIRTFDNALIAIPNALVSVSSVRNWNRRAIGRRIKMHVGVTYESNMVDIRKALDEIKTLLREHPEIANPKHDTVGSKNIRYRFSSHEDTQGIKATQLVFLDRFSDFSIDILIYCFSRTVKWDEWLAVKEDILFKIAEILNNNNLEFAYPTAVRVHRMEKGYENQNDGFRMGDQVDRLA